MTSALKFYKTGFFMLFFLMGILKTCLKNKTNLGNFVTVGDTFILRLTFKVKSQNKYKKQYRQFEK
jgi:hypothetical protein